MFIWTDQPLAEMWNQLRHLKSEANVRNMLTGTTKSARTLTFPAGPSTDERAFSISAAIQQAEEYFHAARAVGLATRPLLLYYGAHALSKAVLLASNSALSAPSFVGHGLSDRSGPSIPADKRQATTTKNGLFTLLCTTLEPTSAPPAGTVLRLDDLLARFPDLAASYERLYGAKGRCLPIYSVGDRELLFQQRVTPAEILAVFPSFSEARFTPTSRHGAHGFFFPPEPIDFLALEDGSVGGRYAIALEPTGPNNILTRLFAAIFIASSLVRYEPDLWMRTLRGIDTGSAYLFEALCNLVERAFPKRALEALWQEGFTFGTPGYLT